MSGKAATIKLTERQLLVLQRIERSTTSAARLIQRVRIDSTGFRRIAQFGNCCRSGMEKFPGGLVEATLAGIV